MAVLSGKGGVGKSNVAVNLALALSQKGRRVYLWDMDLGLANVDVLLNLSVHGDLSDVLRGKKTIREIVVEGPSRVKVIPGSSGDERLANLTFRGRRYLIRAMEELTREADYLVIDTGAGISENTIDFARTVDEVLMITTPEPTAMLDAYATIKLLHRTAPWSHLHLIVNMARNHREAQHTLWRMGSMAEEFIGSHLARDGYILYDNSVGDAVRHRLPYLLAYPLSEASRQVRAIADILDANPPAATGQPEQGGFLKRLLDHFGP